MLSNEAKELFAKLEMEFPPIAMKYSFGKPEGLPHVDEPAAFCEFLKKAQASDTGFYTTASDDTCFGRMVLGMIDEPPFAASGQAGFDFGIFATQAPNARLYTQMPKLTRGSVNFVSFAPVSACEFDPDLIVCVANTQQAAILMRASSYFSGDIWEAKATPVMSCEWMFAYPYVENKINTLLTGMGHGMTRRKLYPAGLQIISIPYGKIGEMVRALGEMRWDFLSMSDDPADKAEFARRTGNWDAIQESAKDLIPVDTKSLMPSKHHDE